MKPKFAAEGHPGLRSPAAPGCCRGLLVGCFAPGLRRGPYPLKDWWNRRDPQKRGTGGLPPPPKREYRGSGGSKREGKGVWVPLNGGERPDNVINRINGGKYE